VRWRFKKISWGELVQPLTYFLHILFCQFGSVSARTLVDQSLQPHLPVAFAPFHQAGATASRERLDLGDRVTDTVQVHGLVAHTCWTIIATLICSEKFVYLLSSELELSARHIYIVRILIDSSIIGLY
jgi:hypothetical protein